MSLTTVGGLAGGCGQIECLATSGADGLGSIQFKNISSEIFSD